MSGGSATSKMWLPNKEIFEYNEELSVKRRSSPFNTHLSIYGSFLCHHPLVTPRISMLNPDQQLCEDKRAWKKFRQEAGMNIIEVTDHFLSVESL